MPTPRDDSNQCHDAGILQAAYHELHALAAGYLRAERRSHTLQATALLHEAWLRLRHHGEGVADRTAFLRAAAATMRRILVDHARARTRRKRAPALGQRIAFDDQSLAAPVDHVAVLEIDEYLQQLAAVSARRAEILHLRYFGGLTEPDIAAVIGVSRRTVQYELGSARAWLLARLDAAGEGASEAAVS